MDKLFVIGEDLNGYRVFPKQPNTPGKTLAFNTVRVGEANFLNGPIGNGVRDSWFSKNNNVRLVGLEKGFKGPMERRRSCPLAVPNKEGKIHLRGGWRLDRPGRSVQRVIFLESCFDGFGKSRFVIRWLAAKSFRDSIGKFR